MSKLFSGHNFALCGPIYFRSRQQYSISGAGVLAAPHTADFLVIIYYYTLFDTYHISDKQCDTSSSAVLRERFA